MTEIYAKKLLIGGWAYPSEKYEFVNWDDEISSYMEKTFSSHHQAAIVTIVKWMDQPALNQV